MPSIDATIAGRLCRGLAGPRGLSSAQYAVCSMQYAEGREQRAVVQRCMDEYG